MLPLVTFPGEFWFAYETYHTRILVFEKKCTYALTYSNVYNVGVSSSDAAQRHNIAMLTRDTDIEILSRVKFQYRIEMSLHVVTVSSPHGSPSFYSFISIKACSRNSDVVIPCGCGAVNTGGV